MVCTSTCAIAAAFLGGMLWIMFTADKDVLMRYKHSLNDKQLGVYRFVAVNRARIAMTGFMYGAVLGGLYLLMNRRQAGVVNGCVFAAIAMGVNYFYYNLSDKGTYMIQHLEKSQVPGWLEAKKMMQTKYHVGMLIGLVGCFLMGKGLSR